MKEGFENTENTGNTIPETQLVKLFDATGTAYGGNKGYILFYINEQGNPFAVMKFENQAVKMSLEKAVDLLKMSMEQSEFMSSIGFDPEEGNGGDASL